MQDYIFPSASSTAIFLNGFHVEMAYGLQWKDNIPKVPIYGYNDYEYTKVARGKGMVQGMLILNFVYPGYLTAVLGRRPAAYSSKLYNYNIAEDGPSANIQFQKDVKDKLATELPPNTDAASRAARAQYIASILQSKDPVKRLKTKEALIKFFTPKTTLDTSEIGDGINREGKSIDNPLTMVSYSKAGNELDIYYHDPEYAAFFVRICNVEFTEISQQISQAGSEGSSEPLFHVCQFIGQSIQIKQIPE